MTVKCSECELTAEFAVHHETDHPGFHLFVWPKDIPSVAGAQDRRTSKESVSAAHTRDEREGGGMKPRKKTILVYGNEEHELHAPTAVERARAALSDAERNLKEMRRNLLDAQEWVRNAEQLHSEKQRELAQALKAEIQEER